MIKEISVESSERNELIDITGMIQKSVREIEEGVVTIYVTHTTAAVTINENADPDVKRDIINKLNGMVPEGDNYLHSEGNSDSHIKSTLVGPSVNVIVKEGKLLLGTWQSVFFCEFDGPRRRKIILKV